MLAGGATVAYQAGGKEHEQGQPQEADQDEQSEEVSP
jgi:hypothetical protein